MLGGGVSDRVFRYVVQVEWGSQAEGVCIWTIRGPSSSGPNLGSRLSVNGSGRKNETLTYHLQLRPFLVGGVQFIADLNCSIIVIDICWIFLKVASLWKIGVSCCVLRESEGERQRERGIEEETERASEKERESEYRREEKEEPSNSEFEVAIDILLDA